MNSKAVLLVVLVCALAPAAAAQAPGAVVARGKYLVENAGACHYCHTPKLANGDPDQSKWMKGAVLDYGPLPSKTILNWHKTSPDLTPSGTLFKKWGPEALVRFLQTGRTPKETFAGPPMPTYRFTREDALAIVEYLKTLP